ncbi:unnamed protein product [Spirodela intermedia]|uniref:Uncharacterized protein n=1 Tax=Spirodela intermedia TaxID=51605 RepID=A0A7I8JV22_SPIIN|nr:unnamed protein product [Spirodela intermedia]CAA6673453.1 unnamed protein product [Spirodela intermedia]
MKGNFGAFGAVTLEKSKLDLSQKTTRTSPETAIGGGGGDIGKRNSHGGGDGGDDGGDDDDYFGDFDDFDEGDDGGLFRRRLILQELFDRKFVDAVLQEWYKTMVNLPAGLFQAYEMGLVSSAQMVRFLSIHARPTITRFISRALPDSLSREFIGRMIADPSFLYKLCLEQVATVGYSVWWELKNRKGSFYLKKIRWVLQDQGGVGSRLINILTVSACNAVVVWSLAPCHSYANTFQFEWQNALNKLPNNVFEKNYLLREFDLQKRIQSFFYKAAGLSLAGWPLEWPRAPSPTTLLGRRRGGKVNHQLGRRAAFFSWLSVTVPSVNTNALGYGAFLGLYANLRYQLLNGLDRALFNRFDVLGVALFFSTALRMLNVQVGETSRRAWLGVEADPLTQSDNLLKAYNRPAATGGGPQEPSSSKWFISKNAIISGLGLLGIKQSTTDVDDPTAAAPPKARRKRVVRKKLSPASS